jgi:shikimate 5-dehydrogenase
MVDVLDESAKKWGAVNTIRFDVRGAIGFNTDADAIVTALREDLKMELRGKKVFCLVRAGQGGRRR